MPTSRRSLRLALLLLAAALVAGVGLLLAAVASSSASVRDGVSPDVAEAELQQVLARWPGPAWVELREAGGRWEAVTRPELEPPGATPPRTLHGLLWDPSGGRLVRVSVPAWAAGLTRWKLSLMGAAIEPLERQLGLPLALPDPSRRGQGLLVDHAFPDGRRVLVWGE